MFDLMSPKRKASKTPLCITPKKRRIADSAMFSAKPDQLPADLTDLVDEEEKRSRLCLICERVRDMALVPSPCNHGQVHTRCAMAFNILEHIRYCPEIGCGKDLTEYIYVAAELQLERMGNLQGNPGQKGKDVGRGLAHQRQPISNIEDDDFSSPDRTTPDKLGSLLQKTQIFNREERRLNEATGDIEIISHGGFSSWEIERHRQMDIADVESLASSRTHSPSPDEAARLENADSFTQNVRGDTSVQSSPHTLSGTHGHEADVRRTPQARFDDTLTKLRFSKDLQPTVESVEDEEFYSARRGRPSFSTHVPNEDETPSPRRAKSRQYPLGGTHVSNEDEISFLRRPKPRLSPLGGTKDSDEDETPSPRRAKPRDSSLASSLSDSSLSDSDEDESDEDEVNKTPQPTPAKTSKKRKQQKPRPPRPEPTSPDPIPAEGIVADLTRTDKSLSPRIEDAVDSEANGEKTAESDASQVDVPQSCVACNEEKPEEKISLMTCGHGFHADCLEARLVLYLEEPKKERHLCGVLVSSVAGEVCTADLATAFHLSDDNTGAMSRPNYIVNGKLSVKCVRCDNLKPASGGKREHYFYGLCMHPHCGNCLEDMNREQRPDSAAVNCALCEEDLTVLLRGWWQSYPESPKNRAVSKNSNSRPETPARQGLEEENNIEVYNATSAFVTPSCAENPTLTNDPEISPDPVGVVKYLSQQGVDKAVILKYKDDLTVIVVKTGLFPNDFQPILSKSKGIVDLIEQICEKAISPWKNFGLEKSLEFIRYLQTHAGAVSSNVNASSVQGNLSDAEKRAVLISKRYHTSDFNAGLQRLEKLDSLMDINDELENRRSETLAAVYARLVHCETIALGGKVLGTLEQRKGHFQRAKAMGKKLKSLISGIGGREVLMLLPTELTETQLAKHWPAGTAEMVNLLIRRDKALYEALQELAKICKPYFSAIRSTQGDVSSMLTTILSQAQHLRTPIYQGALALDNLEEFQSQRLTSLDAEIDRKALQSLAPGNLVSPEIISAILGAEIDISLLRADSDMLVTSLNANSAYIMDGHTLVIGSSPGRFLKEFEICGKTLLLPILIPKSVISSTIDSWAIGIYKPGKDKDEVGIVYHSCYASSARSILQAIAVSIAALRLRDVSTEIIFSKPTTFPQAVGEDHGVLLIETAIALLRQEAIPNIINTELCKPRYFEEITKDFKNVLGNRSNIEPTGPRFEEVEGDEDGGVDEPHTGSPGQAEGSEGYSIMVMDKVDRLGASGIAVKVEEDD